METEDTTTSTPAGGPNTPGRCLTKSPNDRVIAGVAGGLGEYFGLDPVLFRIGFVVLSVAGGSGLALYGLGWLLLPEVGDNETPGQRIGRWFHQKPVLAIIGTVIAVNVIANGFWWGGHHDNDGFWGVVLVGLGIAFFVNRKQGRDGEQSEGRGSTPPPSTTSADPETDPLLAEAAALDPMAGTSGTSTMWPPYPAAGTAVRTRPRPFLTPVTLSLLAIGAGVAALVGASLQQYLAAALLLVGAVMLVGSRRGQARGLLVVGLLLVALASGTAIADVRLAGGIGGRELAPRTSSELERPYRLGVGDMTIDLRHLEFREDEKISAEVGVGRLRVLVPRNVDVIAQGDTGIGKIRAIGFDVEGRPSAQRFHYDAPGTNRELRLDLRAGVGQIEMETVDAPPPA